jgi:hypothetical protein
LNERQQFEAGRGCDWIKGLKKETGKNVPELLALTRERDPFYCGHTPTQQEQAKWFARMWEQEYKGQTGIHIRRMHYRLVARGDCLKTNGMPYENRRADWILLTEASRYARILHLVPADAFVDRRNAEPHDLNWPMVDAGLPRIIPADQAEWFLPSLRMAFSSLDWEIEIPGLTGYSPDDYQDRAYYLELWIEKSTMNDICIPLCNELGIRPITSVGFQSITNAVRFLQRVDELKKPARIFYISDHDKAGRRMPIQVARQIEFWRPEFAPASDVKLQTLVLTAEQVSHYKLPRSVDEAESTELDALEALHPGKLVEIIREAVEPYLDRSLPGDLAEAQHEAREIVNEQWSNETESHRQRLQELQKQVRVVSRKYERQAAALGKRLSRDLSKFRKPIAELQAEVAEVSDNFNPDLPERPKQALREQDEAGWLFDSSRSYRDQLMFYKSQHSRR